MGKIKILYVHHSGSKAGAPRSLAYLIKELNKDIYEPYVVCHHDFEQNCQLFEAVGAKVIKGNYIGGWHGSTVCPVTKEIFLYNIKHVIPTYWGIRKIIRDVKPNIVHLNSTCLCFAAKSIKKAYPEIPIICHVREPLLEGGWGDILRRNCNKYVDRFVAIEEFDAKTLKTKKKIDVIYNFVDFAKYNPNIVSDCLRQELNLKSSDRILLYLARVCPENGAKELIENIQSLLKRRPDIHLCIVGANFEEQSAYLMKLEEMSKKFSNIHLIGFRSDVPEVIKSSDIMVVPFQVPHFARSVIEAAAIGIPSIASKIGGVDELIINGKTGLLFNYLTFEGFNTMCEKLLDDEVMYHEMSQNAVQHARYNFSASINAKRTIAIYQEMLDEKLESKK